MKKIEVELEGETPLLMHSAQAMVQQGMKKNLTLPYRSMAYRTRP